MRQILKQPIIYHLAGGQLCSWFASETRIDFIGQISRIL